MVSTAARVPSQTDAAVNRAIREEMTQRLVYFALHPDRIADRLEELDHEWDVERALEANASLASITGFALAMTADRRWLALPAVVSVFLFQHAAQGWCPPLPVLRLLGFRTAEEIGEERYALKALRGDFESVREVTERLQAAAETPRR